MPPVFVCLVKSLSFFHFWRTTLPDKVFLVDSFPPFSTLNILFYSVLACKASAEKLSDSLMVLHLYVMWVNFFFLISKFFLSLSFWQLNYTVSQCIPFLVQTIWAFLHLKNLDVHFSPQIWGLFSHFWTLFCCLLVYLFVRFFNNTTLSGIL